MPTHNDRILKRVELQMNYLAYQRLVTIRLQKEAEPIRQNNITKPSKFPNGQLSR